MNDNERKAIRQRFFEKVNMAPSELENWLETEESQNVGWDSGDGEAIGHKSGHKIVSIKHKNVAELSEQDYEHMKKVSSYISRHMAQKPSSDRKNSKWRYSLINWGCDPCKETNC
ncbi:MAG: DUF3140 domain-containing protein [Candidatus Cyclobacteriaceae bacterium M3_2C_046]